MSSRNRKKKSMRNRKTTAPVEQSVTAPAPEPEPATVPTSEMGSFALARSRYLACVRPMGAGQQIALRGAGGLIRLVLTYVIAQFCLQFAVLFAAREGHNAFLTLAQDAAAEEANVNMLMNEYNATTAASAALGGVIGIVAVGLAWMLLSLLWWWFVARTQDTLDMREVRRDERKAKADEVRERRENARSQRLSQRRERSERKSAGGSSQAAESDPETVVADAEETKDTEKVSTNG